MQIINNVFEQRAERKSKTFARLCYSTPTVLYLVGGVVATLSIGVTEKNGARQAGFREGRLRELVNSPYQPSQHKFSGTHMGVDRPLEGGLALG